MFCVKNFELKFTLKFIAKVRFTGLALVDSLRAFSDRYLRSAHAAAAN